MTDQLMNAIEHVLQDHQTRSEQVGAREQLRAAYRAALATHADDGEPVDFVTAGFSDDGPNWFKRIRDDEHYLDSLMIHKSNGRVTVRQYNLLSGASCTVFTKGVVNTNAELRRLLSALGVDVKPV